MSDPGVVLDASALVAYAQNDLHSLPVDELLRELREDTGGRVVIPWYALEDAQHILRDDKPALTRLEALATAHGVKLADADTQHVVDLICAEAPVSRGMAHAMLLAVANAAPLATYAAPTLQQAGFDVRLVLDLDEFFRAE